MNRPQASGGAVAGPLGGELRWPGIRAVAMVAADSSPKPKEVADMKVQVFLLGSRAPAATPLIRLIVEGVFVSEGEKSHEDP